MKTENKGRKTFVMFLLAFLIGFFIVSAFEVVRSSFFKASPLPNVQEASAVSTAKISQGPLSFADLAERLKPSVVNISTTKIIRGGGLRSPFEGSPLGRYFGGDDFFEHFFGDSPQREFKQKSLGSGFIISHDGYIFTNNHVVEQADKILVKLSNGKEYDAKVIGKDAKTDLALIKIKPVDSLPVADTGDSDKLRVGDWVMAIGNPFGLEQTVTVGIVSAKGRVIGAGPYDNFIQTDASINPGNSGGPLFNMEGQVIGINTAIVAQGQGIGFAIPISMAKTILPDLKARGKVTRGWMGVSVQDINDDIAKSMRLKEGQKGALVSDVVEGDPAEKAGLRAGDVITEINGKGVQNTHELLLLIAGLRVGETVRVKVVRNGQEKIFPILIAERTDKTEMASSIVSGEAFGISVQEITPEMAGKLGLSVKSGIIVVDVQGGSLADEAGIQSQDLILQVNKARVATLRQYKSEIAKVGAKGSVVLLIKRGRTTFFVPLVK
jgi:serine protease Do